MQHAQRSAAADKQRSLLLTSAATSERAHSHLVLAALIFTVHSAGAAVHGAAALHSIDGNRTELYEALYAQHGYHADLTLTHAGGLISAIVRPYFSGRKARVLDVGSSHGLGVQLLWKMGLVASGMDLAQTAVDIATRVRTPPEATSCVDACFRQGSADAIPWPDAAFDAVMSTDVLEHVPAARVDSVVSEFTRVAREALFLVIALNVEGSKFGNVGLLHETVQSESWWRSKFESGRQWRCQSSRHTTSRAHHLHNAWLQCNRTGFTR